MYGYYLCICLAAAKQLFNKKSSFFKMDRNNALLLFLLEVEYYKLQKYEYCNVFIDADLISFHNLM